MRSSLNLEPRDPSKPCYVKVYYTWFSRSDMFGRIMEDAESIRCKIIEYQDGILSCTVKFQARPREYTGVSPRADLLMSTIAVNSGRSRSS